MYNYAFVIFDSELDDKSSRCDIYEIGLFCTLDKKAAGNYSNAFHTNMVIAFDVILDSKSSKRNFYLKPKKHSLFYENS